ncbi:MAG: sigma-54-dependent Fis family transcriptional regulator [Acidobacteria bacterium]|nr:sigma-54-dependent Fis family transcriptional regulator [Acidobacteriota bacterium]
MTIAERQLPSNSLAQPRPRTQALLGESAPINEVREAIASAARTNAKVLILGETGVGKEVVAQLIHAQSARASRPFIAVNCSGIPETLLESELFGHSRGSFTGAYRDKVGLVRQADRGTLFLDELGEMSLRMQAVLLRFAETGEVQAVGSDQPGGRADVRLITATNRDLRAQIEAGAFREDLYYRLNVIQIQVPPLRERGNDILTLFDHYLDHASHTHGLPKPTLTPDAAQQLLTYAWPGNVRELRNVTERVVLRNRTRPLTPEDLPLEMRGGHTAPATTVSVSPSSTESPAPREARSDRVQQLWDRMQVGEDFWAVVREAFRARELTRGELAALVDRGLQETRGSYRALLKIFRLPPSDYKRLHAFLYQQQCNLPVAQYRKARTTGAQASAGSR